MSKVIEVTKNMDVFVIPKPARPVSMIFFDKEESRKYFSDMAELNGLNYDPEEDLVPLRFVEMDEDWNHPEDENSRLCDNWRIDGYFTHIEKEYLPVSWLGKEGDVISLKFPTIASKIDSSGARWGEKSDMIIDANVRSNQSDYRYRSLGKFEEVVQRVCKRR